MALRVPSDAVGFDSAGGAFVWVLEDEGGGVYAAADDPTGDRGGDIGVTAGLAAGERIAAAGVAILTRAGVRLLRTRPARRPRLRRGGAGGGSMSLARFPHRTRRPTYTLSLALLLGGLWAYMQIVAAEDPEFTIKNAQIITQYPGRWPEVMEEVMT